MESTSGSQDSDGLRLRTNSRLSVVKEDGPGTQGRLAEGLLKDQIRRHLRPPFLPSLSVAFRILFLVRFAGAIYGQITDCDEVFNYWEPLHYFLNGSGLQTWEYAPQFAIRSWAFIGTFAALIEPFRSFGRLDPWQVFLGVRIMLAAASAASEAVLYRRVAEVTNRRVGRYMLTFLIFSSGMWTATTSFLPSNFALIAINLAMAGHMPAAQNGKWIGLADKTSQQVWQSVFFFALAVLLGWPFTAILAIPFVIEQLTLYGQESVAPDLKGDWFKIRVRRFVTAALVCGLSILLPMVAIDYFAYKKLTIVPWNIIKYNILGSGGQGPELYGTEPWYYYLLNNTLAFNLVFLLALGSLPALALTSVIDPKRLGPKAWPTTTSSPYTILTIRLLPFYLWLFIFSAQPHKEERFMYPIYTLICFNGAVTLYLVRGWMEKLYIKATNSTYQASVTVLFTNVTFLVIVMSVVLSVSRILALHQSYAAPIQVYRRIGMTASLVEDTLPPNKTRWPLASASSKELTICVGKEWHRFPSSFLLPPNARLAFLKSEFKGVLPTAFQEYVDDDERNSIRPPQPPLLLPGWRALLKGISPSGQGAQNDLNQEQTDRYVHQDQCDYLVDSDFPARHGHSELEPRFVLDSDHWDRIFCLPFLDAENSPRSTRLFWTPVSRKLNTWGEYCLLKRKARIEK